MPKPRRPRTVRLKVACLQYDPQRGQKDLNMAHADNLLANLTQSTGLDMLVLPEMAFIGYHFTDRADIAPLVEGPNGPTEKWCRRHATRLRCAVFCGYAAMESDAPNAPYYNAMLVVGPDGSVLARYRKHFLYLTDETWAVPGDRFQTVTLPSGISVGLGICMDINPHKFQAPWEAFELARHCLAARVQVIAFCSNWCTAHPDDSLETKAKPPNQVDTLQYWAGRLEPLIGRPVFFVVGDRVGKESLAPIGREGETTFCGSSCVLSLWEPTVVAALDTTTEGVLVTEFDVPEP